MKGKIIILLCAMISMTACDDRPDMVISQSHMEDVLYDYHIAQAMISHLTHDRDSLAQSYIDAV